MKTQTPKSTTLEGIMTEFPTLCYQGARRAFKMNDDEAHASRAELVHAPTEIAAARKWIAENCSKRKTINRGPGSYGLKHQIERGVGIYISNGSCIAAFLLEGYSFNQQGINGFFNVSMRKKAP